MNALPRGWRKAEPNPDAPWGKEHAAHAIYRHKSGACLYLFWDCASGWYWHLAKPTGKHTVITDGENMSATVTPRPTGELWREISQQLNAK